MESYLHQLHELYRDIRQEKYVKYKGSILPPKHLRLCSRDYRDDRYFLKSAELEAERLRTRLDCDLSSRVLDIGCGAGRLAIGILRRIGDIDYYGLDVLRDRIDWCNRFLARSHPSFHFLFLDVYSTRYNTSGRPIDDTFMFEFPDSHFDIVNLYGVLTNMTETHAKIYLRDIHRLIKPGGRVFLSAFVERDVPNVTVNPEGYLGIVSTGPLQIVRYDTNYFLSILRDSDLKLTDMEKMGQEFHESQTAFYLTK